MVELVLAMLFSGLLGGWASYLVRAGSVANAANPGGVSLAEAGKVGTYLVSGVAAAFCVPIFLLVTQSNILETFIKHYADDKTHLNAFIDLLYVAGLCLIVSYSARSFMQTVSYQVLRQLRETQEKANDATSRAASAEEKATVATDKAATSAEKASAAAETAARIDTKVVATAQDLEDRLAEVKENLPPRPAADAGPVVHELGGPDAAAENIVAPLDDTSRKLVRVLHDPQFARRSIAGVARDAQIGRTDTVVALEHLQQLGLVLKILGARTRAEFYQLTSRGLMAAASLPEPADVDG